ncbi:MAG TPA: hypothetical protein VKB89_03220 [Xanthobacteraceae bacterium]|nr:hypothetical protein [Xanthobacteraceae bacterium]
MLRRPAYGLSASSQARHRDPPARWAPLTVFHAMCEAMHEGLAMHREYEALRSRGIAHEAALRQALAIGAAAARQMSGTIAPLYFASRA